MAQSKKQETFSLPTEDSWKLRKQTLSANTRRSTDRKESQAIAIAARKAECHRSSK